LTPPGDDGLAGKFLAVLPVDANATVSKDFFSRTPARQSAMAVQGLAPATWLNAVLHGT
jgi:hypothetical protein